jgi:predicted dehydrogenase
MTGPGRPSISVVLAANRAGKHALVEKPLAMRERGTPQTVAAMLEFSQAA